jgi:hypothetical protein
MGKSDGVTPAGAGWYAPDHELYEYFKLNEPQNSRARKAAVNILDNAPRSLLAGANRIHLERVVELFQRIRGDCDGAAASLGLPAKDDGLAAVKFLAEAVIEAVRKERNEQPSQPRRRKSGPHKSSEQLFIHWDADYPQKREYLRATPNILAKWIAEIDEDLRLGKTKAGKTLERFEVKYLRDRRQQLEQRLAALKSGKAKRPRISEVRKMVSEQFVSSGHYGKPRKGNDALIYIQEKLKRARRSARKKAPTK